MEHVEATPGDPLGLGGLLPIGSVVLLTGGEMPLMIYGRAQRAVADGQMWDYVAVPYPEGNSDREHTYLFNRTQIRKLLFIGFHTEVEEQLRGYLMRRERGEDVGAWPVSTPEEASLS